MPLITLEQAKDQVSVYDDEENDRLEGLINAAIGHVEQAIHRDIYEEQADVPSTANDPIVISTLKETHKASLRQACLLVLSSLHTTREADTEQELKTNPAFNALIAGFKRVPIG